MNRIADFRLREFAIRTPLGAQPGDVRRLVLAHAVRLWISGSAIGLLAAWLAGRALHSQLYGGEAPTRLRWRRRRSCCS